MTLKIGHDMRSKLGKLIVMVVAVIMSVSIQAQSDTIMAVQADVTAVETGQYYTVSVILRDAVDVWQVNAELAYDPALLYVVGTVSGQPMTAGDFFGEKPSLIVRNGISAGRVVYTQSLVAPADPHDGNGTVATFQIYPLSAGTAQIRFTSADLTKVNFEEAADGSRDVQSTEDLPVLPALAEFTITGETVEPPDESTPTPVPTATQEAFDRGGEITEEAPLLNITLAPVEETAEVTAEPQIMPTLIPELVEEDTEALPILPIAIGLLVFGGLGVLVLIVMSRRRN